CNFLGILVPNVKPKTILTLQQRGSLVWIDMALNDNNNAFAKPVWSMILGEGIKFPSAPMASHPIRRKNNQKERSVLQRLLNFGSELVTICNALRVAPDLRALRS